MPHWVGAPDQSAYREDIQTNEGIRFIQENADRPFFLYQSYYTPHAPFQPPHKYAEFYKDREIDHKNYYASVTSLDHNVGRIVRTLEKQGILDNTLIIISTDHGGSFQDRPGSYRGMGIAYDEAARIPMIMHCPGGCPKGWPGCPASAWWILPRQYLPQPISIQKAASWKSLPAGKGLLSTAGT